MAQITRRRVLSAGSTTAIFGAPVIRSRRAELIGESRNFIEVDFGNPTGVTVMPQLWGVAMAGTGWKENYLNPRWRSAVRGLNFQFVRQHLEGLLGAIFPAYNASPNWAAIEPFVQHVHAVFPNAQLQIGGAWFPNYMNDGNGTWRSASTRDIKWAVAMWTQLAQYLIARGVTVTFWDGVFNEPDLQGLANTHGTTISSEVVGTVSAAVFNALKRINPDWVFTGPCTAWWNPAYNEAINRAFPDLAYNSFHRYAGPVPDWRKLIVPRGIFYGKRPGLLNEYNENVHGGPPNGTMQASVWGAVQMMVGVSTQNLAIGAYWQVSPDGGFPGVMDDGSIHAPMHLLSRAGQHVFGTAVQCSNPGSEPSGAVKVYALACKSGSRFGILLTNYGSSTYSGSVALRNWPGNPSGSGSITMWQQSGYESVGTTTSLQAEQGTTPPVTLPGTSNTILYVS
jgi:hypothetical protein